MGKAALAWVLAVGSAIAALPGCAGQHPFRMAQLCLRDEQGVAAFTGAMKEIAESENMEFVDGGAATQKDLRRLHASPDYRLVYLGIKGPDGMGLEAGNLGLSAYEVAIGFSTGSNPAAAHRFAERVIGTLGKRWKVYGVPAGRGALPLADCRIR